MYQLLHAFYYRTKDTQHWVSEDLIIMIITKSLIYQQYQKYSFDQNYYPSCLHNL